MKFDFLHCALIGLIVLVSIFLFEAHYREGMKKFYPYVLGYPNVSDTNQGHPFYTGDEELRDLARVSNFEKRYNTSE